MFLVAILTAFALLPTRTFASNTQCQYVLRQELFDLLDRHPEFIKRVVADRMPPQTLQFKGPHGETVQRDLLAIVKREQRIYLIFEDVKGERQEVLLESFLKFAQPGSLKLGGVDRLSPFGDIHKIIEKLSHSDKTPRAYRDLELEISVAIFNLDPGMQGFPVLFPANTSPIQYEARIHGELIHLYQLYKKQGRFTGNQADLAQQQILQYFKTKMKDTPDGIPESIWKRMEPDEKMNLLVEAFQKKAQTDSSP